MKNVLLYVAIFAVGLGIGSLNSSVIEVEKVVKIPFWDTDYETDMAKAEKVANLYNKTFQDKKIIDELHRLNKIEIESVQHRNRQELEDKQRQGKIELENKAREIKGISHENYQNGFLDGLKIGVTKR